MTLNDLAKQITQKEGKKVQVNIAQTKEVLRHTLLILKDMTIEDLTALLKKVK